MKMMARGLLALIVVGAAAQPAVAQRAWTAERFERCLQVEGEDQLAPALIIRSMNCRFGRDPIVEREGDAGEVTMVASVAGAVNKESPEASFVSIVVAARSTRSDNYIGRQIITSDRRGPLNFQSGYTMIGGERRELQMARGDDAPPRCSIMRRGSVSGRICSYTEGVTFLLPAEALAELSAGYTTSADHQFRMRLTTDSGAAFIIELPAAEIEAVRRAVTAAVGRFVRR